MDLSKDSRGRSLEEDKMGKYLVLLFMLVFVGCGDPTGCETCQEESPCPTEEPCDSCPTPFPVPTDNPCEFGCCVDEECTMLSQGPKSPSTLADDASFGTIVWTNPSNASSSDNVYAEATTGSDGVNSHYLKATNFGFSLPTNAIIRGILVEVERQSNSVGIQFARDSRVRIVKSGTIGSTDKADTVTLWPLADAYVSYGSIADLWGELWTVSDINNSTTGFVIAAQDPAGAGSGLLADIDHIRMTVYYDFPNPLALTF